MNPLVDQLLVAALILGALGYFATRFFRRRSTGKGCGSDCGCSGKAERKS